MIASLDMYDLPELREATDAWWHALAVAFRTEGLADVPPQLTRSGDESHAWSAPGLFLSQICGYPLRKCFGGRLRVVGTPCYTAEGCAGPRYRSAVIVRRDADISEIPALEGCRFAYNSPASQSGMSAFRALLAIEGTTPGFLGECLPSGTHRASLAMVTRGDADVAAIDCVTLALLQRHAPAECERIKILAWTPDSPGLPYIVPASCPEDQIAAIRRGIAQALDAPETAEIRDSLLITGFANLEDAAYLEIDRMEVRARELGLASLLPTS